MDSLSVFFLAQGEQSGAEVMARLTAFIGTARQSLDFAVYDMRFSDPLKATLSSALRERAGAGVRIRFCYDGDKPSPPNVAAGQDPAPSGTGAFVQSLGYPWRQIAGMKLMHNKFVVRDGESIWTGSTNLTDDAFTLMENNVVKIDSEPLANYYMKEFEQLWEKENFDRSGEFHADPVPFTFSGAPAEARVMFSPGC
ncbi:MAG: phospholipase D-like domain-containing protein, partial [Chthoniobacterales bacterium]